MTFGDESDRQGAKFKDVVLPPGALDDPANEVLKVTGRDPRADPAKSAPRSAARKQGPASGRTSWNRRLRPRHRGVVQKYFGGK
ncbi:MAG: hypothetical protein CMJ65_15875 [Planctomycetaceae bacterium]|jgi:hypothetical protein|nr:hypothetical protein [Planctomycetaceae bacterium]MDP7274588.1 hypothetical protein [Planctomycetaceae bacterium]